MSLNDTFHWEIFNCIHKKLLQQYAPHKNDHCQLAMVIYLMSLNK